ncbi:unnamed protein product [Symbiodinium sp. CCMP2456]|nr:unnamed protein product [Symbiodinium sp. CCMP2456]
MTIHLLLAALTAVVGVQGAVHASSNGASQGYKSCDDERAVCEGASSLLSLNWGGMFGRRDRPVTSAPTSSTTSPATPAPTSAPTTQSIHLTTSFQDIAEQMSKAKWDKMQWGPPDANGKRATFALGGAMINGLLYMAAFVQGSVNGQDNWVDFAKGIGTVLGQAAMEIPDVGPFLSIAITFGLSLFGGSSDGMQAAFEKLYETIMKNVRKLITMQDVKEAMQTTEDRLGNLMKLLYNIPIDIGQIAGLPAAEADKRNQYWNALNLKLQFFEGSNAQIFGAQVGCVGSDGTTPLQRSDQIQTTDISVLTECQQYWAHGAFLPQLHFVMMHLHLRAQMAFLASDAAAKSQQLQRLREVAGVYVPLLQDSYNGLIIWTQGYVPRCDWEYPANWSMNGFSDCEHSISSTNSADCDRLNAQVKNLYLAPATFQADPDVSCLTGCKTFKETNFPWPNPTNLCSTPQSGRGYPTLGPWPLCSQEDIGMAAGIKTAELKAMFHPILEKLEKFAENKLGYSSSELLDWIQSHAQAPGTKTVGEAADFCERFCFSIHDTMKSGAGQALDQANALYAKFDCTETCLKASAPVDTRCSCRTDACPSILANISRALNESLDTGDWWQGFLSMLQRPDWALTCNQSCNEFPLQTVQSLQSS